MRPLRDAAAAWRCWRRLRAAHGDLFPASDAWLGFGRILMPQRLRHRLGWKRLREGCDVSTDPGGGYRVRVKSLGLEFLWPTPPDCDTWFALEQEVDPANPHCYTTPPIRLGPSSTVLDVGACEGLFAFRVLRQGLARRVIAFEPFPSMASLLARGAAANGIGPELRHEPLAVAARSGPMGFRIGAGADAGQVVSDPGPGFEGVRVTATSLDDYAARTGLELGRGDLIKIDAEGADWDVLRGAEGLIRSGAPQVAVTTYHADDHAAGIADWLRLVQPAYRMRLKGFSYWTPVPRPVLLQASAL